MIRGDADRAWHAAHSPNSYNHSGETARAYGAATLAEPGNAHVCAITLAGCACAAAAAAAAAGCVMLELGNHLLVSINMLELHLLSRPDSQDTKKRIDNAVHQ